MSVIQPYSICGYLVHQNQQYELIVPPRSGELSANITLADTLSPMTNRPLPNDLLEKYNSLDTSNKVKCLSSAPWACTRCRWEIRDDVLYLTEMFRGGILKLLIDRDELVADWVERLRVFIRTESIADDDLRVIIHYVDYEFDNSKLTNITEPRSVRVRNVGRRLKNYIED